MKRAIQEFLTKIECGAFWNVRLNTMANFFSQITIRFYGISIRGVAIGIIIKTPYKDEPYACNCGLSDEDIQEITKEDK